MNKLSEEGKENWVDVTETPEVEDSSTEAVIAVEEDIPSDITPISVEESEEPPVLEENTDEVSLFGPVDYPSDDVDELSDEVEQLTAAAAAAAAAQEHLALSLTDQLVSVTSPDLTSLLEEEAKRATAGIKQSQYNCRYMFQCFGVD